MNLKNSTDQFEGVGMGFRLFRIVSFTFMYGSTWGREKGKRFGESTVRSEKNARAVPSIPYVYMTVYIHNPHPYYHLIDVRRHIKENRISILNTLGESSSP